MPRQRFAIGDQVCIERDQTRYSSKGTWPQFRGKTGTVIMVNRGEFGVAFGTISYRADGSLKSGNVAWFKANEQTGEPTTSIPMPWIRAARPLVWLSSCRRSATGSPSNTPPEVIFE